MGRPHTKRCKSCRMTYSTWEESHMCLSCRKIRFHMRKVMPDHIPDEQTLKFLEMYKIKNESKTQV